MTRELQVNWDDVATFELVPPGRYPARIDKVEERQARSGDRNDYWNVTFTLTEEPYIGRKVWGVFMLQPQSLWKLRQLLKAIGTPTEGVGNLSADELVGQEVGLVIDQEEYQGQTRSRVQSFYSLL